MNGFGMGRLGPSLLLLMHQSMQFDKSGTTSTNCWRMTVTCRHMSKVIEDKEVGLYKYLCVAGIPIDKEITKVHRYVIVLHTKYPKSAIAQDMRWETVLT